MNVDPMGSVTTYSYPREIRLAASAGSLVMNDQIRAQIPEMTEPVARRDEHLGRLLRLSILDSVRGL